MFRRAKQIHLAEIGRVLKVLRNYKCIEFHFASKPAPDLFDEKVPFFKYLFCEFVLRIIPQKVAVHF